MYSFFFPEIIRPQCMQSFWVSPFNQLIHLHWFSYLCPHLKDNRFPFSRTRIVLHLVQTHFPSWYCFCFLESTWTMSLHCTFHLFFTRLILLQSWLSCRLIILLLLNIPRLLLFWALPCENVCTMYSPHYLHCILFWFLVVCFYYWVMFIYIAVCTAFGFIEAWILHAAPNLI